MENKFLNIEFENGLNSSVKDILLECSRVADLNNYSIYLIGGVVRDLILGREIFDVDIIVEGNAVDFANILLRDLDCSILQIQPDLKTAKVSFTNNIEVDFASTRCEDYPDSGFLPVIDKISCSLEQDVLRRDFSINSMAMSLNKEKMFLLVDYLNGYEDLINQKLRILHDKSFVDDPSRIVRGLKFALRFGFELEKRTKELQDEYLNLPPNTSMPLERVKSELKQLFTLNKPEAFEDLIAQKIYKLITLNPNCITSVTKIAEAIDLFSVEQEKIWLVYLGVLLLNESSELFSRLNMSLKEQNTILLAKNLLEKELKKDVDNFDIYSMFNGTDNAALAIYYAQCQDEFAKKYYFELKDIKLEIGGKDLLELGLEPSPAYGKIFQQTLKKKLIGEIHTKSEELEFVKSLL